MWLSLLPAWDQHTVFKHEIEWLDLYLAGMTFEEIHQMIELERGGHEKFSVAV